MSFSPQERFSSVCIPRWLKPEIKTVFPGTSWAICSPFLPRLPMSGATRFRRLARDHQRLAVTLGAFHFLAFACLMIANLFRLLS